MNLIGRARGQSGVFNAGTRCSLGQFSDLEGASFYHEISNGVKVRGQGHESQSKVQLLKGIGFQGGRQVMYTKMVITYQDGGLLPRWWSPVNHVAQKTISRMGLVANGHIFRNSGVRNEDRFLNSEVRNEDQFLNSGVRNEDQFLYSGVRNEDQFLNSGVRNEDQFLNSGVRNEDQFLNSGVRNEDQFLNSGVRNEDQFAKVGSEMKTSFATVGSEMKTSFSTVGSEMKTSFSTVGSEMKTSFSTVGSEMKTSFSTVRSEMKTSFSTVGSEMKTSFSTVGSEMKTSFAVKADQFEQHENLLASHLGEPYLIPGRFTEFSQVVIVPDDAVGMRVFSGISCFHHPFIPALLHTHLNNPHRLLRLCWQDPLKSLHSLLSFKGEAPFTWFGQSPVALVNEQYSVRHGSLHTIQTRANLRTGARNVWKSPLHSHSCLADHRLHPVPSVVQFTFSLVVLLRFVTSQVSSVSLHSFHVSLSMLKDDETDAEIRIHLVQDKSQIWEKSLQDYQNRNMMRDAWRRPVGDLSSRHEQGTGDNPDKLSDRVKTTLCERSLIPALVLLFGLVLHQPIHMKSETVYLIRSRIEFRTTIVQPGISERRKDVHEYVLQTRGVTKPSGSRQGTDSTTKGSTVDRMDLRLQAPTRCLEWRLESVKLTLVADSARATCEHGDDTICPRLRLPGRCLLA
ncbi:hypothetical protein PR048_007365 [Dryococelus australis]|uniref:Uncharacterized protein n=1 Tax=Dryococelus australis TaxID=614101 RepID=A0ABQ9HU18_9NEOP|nr:hypothetical protein PR048_007365 [Dryococelus australis]